MIETSNLDVTGNTMSEWCVNPSLPAIANEQELAPDKEEGTDREEKDDEGWTLNMY